MTLPNPNPQSTHVAASAPLSTTCAHPSFPMSADDVSKHGCCGLFAAKRALCAGSAPSWKRKGIGVGSAKEVLGPEGYCFGFSKAHDSMKSFFPSTVGGKSWC